MGDQGDFDDCGLERLELSQGVAAVAVVMKVAALGFVFRDAGVVVG